MAEVKQQINLYQPDLRTRRQLLSSRAVLQGVAVALVGLLGVYAYASWEAGGLEKRLDQLAQQRDAAEQRLVNLEKTLPAKVRSKQLQAAVLRAENALTQKTKVVEALSTNRLGRAEGFSAYLEGLGRQRVQGLWLTGFRISKGGRELKITGNALEPDLVPVLVQRLSEEEIFTGLKFRMLKIERSLEEPDRVAFVVQTSVDDE